MHSRELQHRTHPTRSVYQSPTIRRRGGGRYGGVSDRVRPRLLATYRHRLNTVTNTTVVARVARVAVGCATRVVAIAVVAKVATRVGVRSGRHAVDSQGSRCRGDIAQVVWRARRRNARCERD